jgi:hypothetical protein
MATMLIMAAILPDPTVIIGPAEIVCMITI